MDILDPKTWNDPSVAIEIRNAEPGLDPEWKTVYVRGQTLHPKATKGVITVDEEFEENMLEAFHHFKRQYGFFPPILPEHGKRKKELKNSDEEEEPEPKEENDGDGIYDMAWGILADMRRGPEGGIQVRPFYADGVKEKVDKGRLPYVSPNHQEKLVDPHTGKVFKNAMVELSFVRKPNMRNLGVFSPWYRTGGEHGFVQLTNEEQEIIMAGENPETKSPEVDETEETPAVETETQAPDLSKVLAAVQEVGKTVKELADELDELVTRVEAVEQGRVPAETDTEEEVEVANSATQALEAEVRALRLRTAKAELQAKYGAEVADEQVEAFAELPNAEQTKLLALVDTLKGVDTPDETAKSKAGVEELGEIGNSAQGSKITEEQARAQLKEEGIKPQHIWAEMHKRFPHLRDQL